MGLAKGLQALGEGSLGKHRGIVASWPAADHTRAPRTCQHLAREDLLPFQESHSQRTRPSPFHGSRYTLCIDRYMEEMPARLLVISRLRACTNIVLHPRIMLLVSLKCHSSPSSTARFK